MPDDPEKLIRDAKDAESSFKDAIRPENDLVNGAQSVTAALNRLRVAVEVLSTTDLLLSRQHTAEGRLWNAHTTLHDLYKRRVKELRAASPARPVETRKLIKAYLEFLKDGQRGYRVYITRLNQRYGGIPELKQIAGNVPPVATRTGTDSTVQEACVQSCYQALIYLGDLARWRATERLDKDPTWGPAIGYYDLAIALRPMSGTAFNQRSVIAQNERDHLRTTYFAYRSIVAAEPFERGQGNLDLHMASLLKRWGSSDLSPAMKSAGPDASSKALTAWFLRLHSLCYIGTTFKDHDEMEAEVLNRIEALIMGSQSSKLLMKIILINMAAQHTALLRLQNAAQTDHATIMQSFYFYQRLNIRTLRLLSEIWLKIMGAGHPPVAIQSLGILRAPKSQIPHITNVLLPLLRVYMLWLATNYRYVLPGPGSVLDKSVEPDAISLWEVCTSMLTATRTVHPPVDLPAVSYLLDEDVDTRCFEPLDQPETDFLRKGQSGAQKPKFNDPHVKRGAPQLEMSARIRDIEWLGQWLADQEGTTLKLAWEHFDFSTRSADATVILSRGGNQAKAGTGGGEQRSQVIHDSPPRGRQPLSMSPGAAHPPLGSPVQFHEAAAGTSPNLDCQEEQARSMVDDLVGPDESPHPIHRSGSVLDVTTQADRSPSSFVPTPATMQSATRPRPESLQGASLFGGGDRGAFVSGLHSPLLFGNGGVWSAPGRSRSMVNETPPNGQGRRN